MMIATCALPGAAGDSAGAGEALGDKVTSACGDGLAATGGAGGDAVSVTATERCVTG